MTRFYFHARRGENVATDTEGTECADIAAAREQALSSAREILAGVIKAAKSETPDCFIIADGGGRELMTVAFNDALPEGLRK